MKTTIDIPDELYRRVKARSAIEGRPVRSVTVELFQRWLDDGPVTPLPHPIAETTAPKYKPTRFDNGPWLEYTRKYIRPGMSHDLAEIDEAIAKGWAAEVAGKLGLSEPKK